MKLSTVSVVDTGPSYIRYWVVDRQHRRWEYRSKRGKPIHLINFKARDMSDETFTGRDIHLRPIIFLHFISLSDSSSLFGGRTRSTETLGTLLDRLVIGLAHLRRRAELRGRREAEDRKEIACCCSRVETAPIGAP